jgi:hypothetical protein
VNTRRLKPRALPELDVAANHAWREGWFQGITVGIVLGACLAVIFLHR